MINRIEITRKQIEDHLKGSAARADIVRALMDLDAKIMNTELQLLSKTDLHSDDKWYVEAYKVYMNLVWLAGVVGTGASDVAGGAEYRPTNGSVQVLAEIEKDLAAAKAGFDALMQKEIPAYNRSAAGKAAPITR